MACVPVSVVWFEVERLLPRVIPGGYLIVHDSHWKGGAIRPRQISATVAERWERA